MRSGHPNDQALGVRLPSRSAGGLSKRPQEGHPIFIIGENRFPPITPIHHVIDRA
jgi:hypothetical protein